GEGDLELLGPRPLALVDLGDVAGEDEQLAFEGVGVVGERRELDRQLRRPLGQGPTSFLTCSRSSRDEKGLPKKSWAPAERLASSVSTSSLAVSIRTFMSPPWSSCCSTVTPSIPGIITSRMTRAGLRFFTSSSASVPFAASRTL